MSETFNAEAFQARLRANPMHDPHAPLTHDNMASFDFAGQYGVRVLASYHGDGSWMFSASVHRGPIHPGRKPSPVDLERWKVEHWCAAVQCLLEVSDGVESIASVRVRPIGRALRWTMKEAVN